MKMSLERESKFVESITENTEVKTKRLG